MWHVWGKKRGAYRVLVRRSEGRRPLARPRRKLKDNIKMIFKKKDGKTWTRSVSG
jgi:hypothetical protein